MGKHRPIENGFTLSQVNLMLALVLLALGRVVGRDIYCICIYLGGLAALRLVFGMESAREQGRMRPVEDKVRECREAWSSSAPAIRGRPGPRRRPRRPDPVSRLRPDRTRRAHRRAGASTRSPACSPRRNDVVGVGVAAKKTGAICATGAEASGNILERGAYPQDRRAVC